MYYLSRSKFVRCSYFLEVAAIELNLDSSNPGTSKHPHMSNRIYDTLDSEYRVYFLICNVSWVLKITVSTKRLFLCFQPHIFVRLGLSVRLEENNNFLIQFHLQPNSF